MNRGKSMFKVSLLLLATTSGVGAQPYDLRGPAPKQGTIIQTRSEMSMPEGTLKFNADGTLTSARAVRKGASTNEIEVVQTDGKQLTMLRFHLPEDWMSTTFERDGEPAEETVEDGPLVGETVLIEWREGDWKKTMLGSEPDEAQRAWLREPFILGKEVYPAKAVAIGDSWVLEGLKLAMVFGFGNALSSDGKATFTLDQVVEEAGDRRAIISYRLELCSKILDESNSPVELSLGGSGKIRRSLRSYLDVSNQFTGQQHIAGSTVQDGKKVQVTIAGTVEIKSWEQVIHNDARAEIIHRARWVPPPQTGAANSAPSTTASVAEPTLSPRQAQIVRAEPSCQGTALACTLRNDFTCNLGSGCTISGQCSGFAEPCFSKGEFACQLAPGCFWQIWSKSCGGFRSCSNQTQFTCASMGGCSWQSRCQGFATACTALGKDQCGWQLGCTWQ